MKWSTMGVIMAVSNGRTMGYLFRAEDGEVAISELSKQQVAGTVILIAPGDAAEQLKTVELYSIQFKREQPVIKRIY